MIRVLIFLFGMATAYALFLAAVLLLFKRGRWELEQYERDSREF